MSYLKLPRQQIQLTAEGTRRDLTLELSERTLRDFRLACNELFFGCFGCLECCLRTCDRRTILAGLGVGGETGAGGGSGSGVRGIGSEISIFSGVFIGD